MGGTDNDQLTVGSGADTFRFDATGFGNDTITDFEDGIDHPSFATSIANEFSDLVITNNGTTSVSVGLSGQTLTVNGATAITLTAADFVFM